MKIFCSCLGSKRSGSVKNHYVKLQKCSSSPLLTGTSQHFTKCHCITWQSTLLRADSLTQSVLCYSSWLICCSLVIASCQTTPDMKTDHAIISNAVGHISLCRYVILLCTGQLTLCSIPLLWYVLHRLWFLKCQVISVTARQDETVATVDFYF